MGSYATQSKVIASPICSSAALHYALSTTSIASLKLVPHHVAGSGARLPLSKVWLAGRWQTEWLAPLTCLLPYSTLEPVTASQGVARPFSSRGGIFTKLQLSSLYLEVQNCQNIHYVFVRLLAQCLNDIQAKALNCLWNVDVFANNVCMNIESRSHHFVFWQR